MAGKRHTQRCASCGAVVGRGKGHEVADRPDLSRARKAALCGQCFAYLWSLKGEELREYIASVTSSQAVA